MTPEELLRVVATPIPISYYEIPLAALENEGMMKHELRAQADVFAEKSLFFERNGRKYVRWFMHPLAHQPPIESIASSLRWKGVWLKRKKGPYRARLTASRSLIIDDGDPRHSFSLKLSLPRAPGSFQEKNIFMKEWTAWTRHNHYLSDLLTQFSIPELQFQYESVGAGLSGKQEDGMLSRTLSGLRDGERYYLPSFALFDDQVPRWIAKRNGSSDPVAFWRKEFIQPLASALAKLRAHTGARHTSPHSQNLLIELDRSWKPTGRVILRDADFYIDEAQFRKLNRVIPAGQTQGLVERSHSEAPELLEERFMLRRGIGRTPSWLGDDGYATWAQEYFETFARTYSETTGIPLNEDYHLKIRGHYKRPTAPKDYIHESAFDDHFARFFVQGGPDQYRQWLDRLSERLMRAPPPPPMPSRLAPAAEANPCGLKWSLRRLLGSGH